MEASIHRSKIEADNPSDVIKCPKLHTKQKIRDDTRIRI